jgi:hypothetical protein
MAAARISSANNLKQIGLAAHNHQDSVGWLPWNGGVDGEDAPDYNLTYPSNRVAGDQREGGYYAGSWAFQLLPYLEQQNLFDQFNQVPPPPEVPWRKWGRITTLPLGYSIAPVKAFLCPGRHRPGETLTPYPNSAPTYGVFVGPYTDYAINSWINDRTHGQLVFGNSNIRIEMIPDGSSNTIFAGQKQVPRGRYTGTAWNLYDMTLLVGMTEGTARNWDTLAQDSAQGYGPPDYWPKEHWGGPFPGGALFVFADGSVRTIRYSVAQGNPSTYPAPNSPTVFGTMLMPADGKVVTFE